MGKWLNFDKKSPLTQSKAERVYRRYLNEEVVIFYEDIKTTCRKAIGTIIGIEDDVIHLESMKTGWRASIDTSVCRVQSICTTQGWGRLETNSEL
jgi:hypothetical protein